MQGVCFTVLHKTKQGLGMDCVRGHGFVVARKPQKAVTPRKTFMHWASADTFRPGLSVLDAGLPRKDSAEEREERQEWTAPCYFDISIMGCGDSFGEDHLIPSQISCAAVLGHFKADNMQSSSWLATLSILIYLLAARPVVQRHLTPSSHVCT